MSKLTGFGVAAMLNNDQGPCGAFVHYTTSLLISSAPVETTASTKEIRAVCKVVRRVTDVAVQWGVIASATCSDGV